MCNILLFVQLCALTQVLCVRLVLQDLIERDSMRNVMKSSTLVYWVPFPLFVFEKDSILFSSPKEETLFHTTWLSPSVPMVKKISEYLETLSVLFSVSSKREKRYPRHMNGFPRSETFISPLRRHGLQKNRKKKIVRGREKKSVRGDSSLSITGYFRAQMLKQQNVSCKHSPKNLK